MNIMADTKTSGMKKRKTEEEQFLLSQPFEKELKITDASKNPTTQALKNKEVQKPQEKIKDYQVSDEVRNPRYRENPPNLKSIWGRLIGMKTHKVYTGHYSGQSYYKLTLDTLDKTDPYRPHWIIVDVMKERLINDQLWEDVINHCWAEQKAIIYYHSRDKGYRMYTWEFLNDDWTKKPKAESLEEV